MHTHKHTHTRAHAHAHAHTHLQETLWKEKLESVLYWGSDFLFEKPVSWNPGRLSVACVMTWLRTGKAL